MTQRAVPSVHSPPRDLRAVCCMLTTFLLLCRSAWNPKLTRGYEGHHGLAVAQGRDVLIKDWQVGGADQGG